MLTVLIVIVFVAGALVLVLLAIVVVAIRQEPRETEMRTVAPCRIAVAVRRLLGVYLRRPAPPADSSKEWPATAWTETTSRPSGGRR
jgi:NADH:ubiquinone oxidoreductase subunit 6 (subunit J)